MEMIRSRILHWQMQTVLSSAPQKAPARFIRANEDANAGGPGRHQGAFSNGNP